MVRRVRTRGIKPNKTYEVNELAEPAGVTTATVRRWLKVGLDKLDGSRPTLIMGFQALDFLDARKSKARRPSGHVSEFYCMRCKTQRGAWGGMADYEAISANGGRLKALCEACKCQCNRNVSARDLPEIRKVLDVAIKGS